MNVLALGEKKKNILSGMKIKTQFIRTYGLQLKWCCEHLHQKRGKIKPVTEASILGN